MVDPREHGFFVLDAPDMMLSRELGIWLADLGVWQNVVWPNNGDRHVDCQHNHAIQVALQSRWDYYCFIESDIRPCTKYSEPFWASDGDVVGIRYPTENTHAWDGPRIHAGMYRTRREVLLALSGKGPLFEWQYNANRTATTDCLCGAFCQRVTDAGFTVVPAGHAHHIPRNHWLTPGTP